jgi:hypothetical protein
MGATGSLGYHAKPHVKLWGLFVFSRRPPRPHSVFTKSAVVRSFSHTPAVTVRSSPWAVSWSACSSHRSSGCSGGRRSCRAGGLGCCHTSCLSETPSRTRRCPTTQTARGSYDTTTAPGCRTAPATCCHGVVHDPCAAGVRSQKHWCVCGRLTLV